jgi:nucleotide-binding universal stress UspA family protein
VLVRGHHRVAWQELVDVVDQRGGTLLVVGRRGVSSLRSVLLGSVSEGAVKHARVPVLVVPAATATH